MSRVWRPRLHLACSLAGTRPCIYTSKAISLCNTLSSSLPVFARTTTVVPYRRSSSIHGHYHKATLSRNMKSTIILSIAISALSAFAAPLLSDHEMRHRAYHGSSTETVCSPEQTPACCNVEDDGQVHIGQCALIPVLGESDCARARDIAQASGEY